MLREFCSIIYKVIYKKFYYKKQKEHHEGAKEDQLPIIPYYFIFDTYHIIIQYII
ncbi:hypothetical protein CLM_3832 [Clostridium botulinum A2 str. Kyoto]|uniref:Uncharacterized protein n=1 Tax=Clostridium botulinum (strain Kyoto / Type A2) TaxID=536232 RepID=C1FM52_CLOBJ|nr:hypothetical protein CLM_3832 [Clostridium botulinum A2 str. Kyoto]